MERQAVTKRPDGALEHDVMAALWDDDGPLQPGEVQPSIRLPRGPRRTESTTNRSSTNRSSTNRSSTNRVNEVLASSSDRSAVLAPFVGTLSKREANRIIDLLQRDR